MAPRCGVCVKSVAITHRALTCDCCKNLCHIKCGNVTPKEYLEYKKLQHFNWTCPTCKNLLPTVIKDNNDHVVDETTILAFKQLAVKIKKQRGLSIAHININGIFHKRHEIHLLLEETEMDILAISETHLDSDISDDEIKMKNYNMLRKDRANDSGWGGVLIYHREPLNGISFEPNIVNDLEMIWLECNVKSQRLLISCLYQPPRNKRTFLRKFETVIDHIHQKRTNFIIVGDFNIDLICEKGSNYQAKNSFNALLSKYNLCNLITEPTRITENSSTLIDHIITPKNCKPKVNNAHAVDLGMSDHHIIHCSIDILRERNKPIIRTVKNYKNVNTDKLKEDIKMVPWHVCDIFDDVDDTVFAWESLYKSVINDHIKERTVKMRKYSHPWINSSIRKQLNNRFKLLRIAQKTPKGSHEWDMYKKARNYCTKILRVAEASYWKEKFNGLTPSSKKFWNCVNEFIGKTKNNKIGPLEDEKGCITNNNQTKCNTLNNYFANIGKQHKIPENAKLQSHFYRVTPALNKISYNFSDLLPAFKRVFKTGKACGHDGIDGKIANMVGDDILDGLHYIAKGCFKTQKFPTKYKIAKVTCIYKNKGPKVKSENYRPISLLCLPGKLLESLFASQIDSHIQQHQLLSNHQWGFRKGRSPELMLIKFTEGLLSKIKSGNFVGVILIDFSKAFDSVCHQTLLKKLHAIGISGEAFEWSKSYLSERKQFTIVNNNKSDLAPVEQGVPQGSLLGPRYYSYHSNDLPEASQEEATTDETEMFADDTSASTSAPTYDELFIRLKSLATRLEDWSLLNGMVIHPGKTKIIIFSQKKFIGPAQNVTINNRSLEIVDNHKVLGTVLDNNLNWKPHTEKVAKKFNSKVKMLKRMMSLNNNILEKFYFATIIPSVTYNIAVWGSCRKSQLDLLDDIHAKAARIIHCLPDSLSTWETLKKVGWSTISYMYKRRLLCLMYKISNNLIDPDICSLFTNVKERRALRRKHQLKVSYDTGSKSSFADRGSKLWNRMPNELTEANSYDVFKRKISKFKTKISSYSFEYNSYNISEDFTFI